MTGHLEEKDLLKTENLAAVLRILFASGGSPERGCCQRAGGLGAPAASLWRRGSLERREEARHRSFSGQAGRSGRQEICEGLPVSERGQHRGGAIGERHGASREVVPPVLHARRCGPVPWLRSGGCFMPSIPMDLGWSVHLRCSRLKSTWACPNTFGNIWNIFVIMGGTFRPKVQANLPQKN